MRHLAFVLWMFISSHASAQDLDRILDRHLKDQHVQFRSLMNSRGLPYFSGQLTSQKLKKAVQLYSSDSEETFAFLFYHYQSDSLHTWLLRSGKEPVLVSRPFTPDSLVVLQNTLAFGLSIDNKLSLVQRGGSGKSYATAKKYRLRAADCLTEVSRMLFPPGIANSLRGTRHLLIMPALNMSAIPFSILKPWPGGGQLIDSLSFMMAHDFSRFLEDAERRNEYDFLDALPLQGGSGPLVVGNPSYEDSCTVGLVSLPGAEQEAQAVARSLNVLPLLGKMASKVKVMGSMEDASFVFIGSHGWSDPDDPLHKSYIALYGEGECGYMTPVEVQAILLERQPLVVLSGCQTGLGKIHEAGIIGLARGFLIAGARSVTMSLWDVDDTETMKLMKLFVEELKKPYAFSPAEPWRQAVLQYRKAESQDPVYWAAFQNFGVPYPISVKVQVSPGR